MPIVGSPFSVNVKRGTDASKCRAYGPGLTKGVIHKVNAFTVETKGEILLLFILFKIVMSFCLDTEECLGINISYLSNAQN